VVKAIEVTLPPAAKVAAPPGIELLDLAPTIGTEVLGIDLREPLTPERFAFLDALLLERKAIFFRDQELTREQHIAFARNWGELEVTPFSKNSAEIEEIATITSDGTDTRTNMWHSDGAWRAEPDLGSVLRAIEVPEVGGDTLFCDMQAAYLDLPDWLKRAVEGQEAVFSARGIYNLDDPIETLTKVELDYPPQRHPVIRTHPLTGRKAIYVDLSYTQHIVGMNYEDSRYILNRLFQQNHRPEFQCRFRWRRNSMAFWDNRSCQHYANADYKGQNIKRMMERVTIRGDRPF
jgi:taurine dioxygenase